MPYAAFREDGVCRGSLWKQHCASPSIVASIHNERSKCQEYCVLIGNTLASYTDLSSYKKGDFPSAELRIVGASSWNPKSHSESPTFRIVTYAGTHVYCTAPSLVDRDVWLSALHSGLEASYTGLDTLPFLLLDKTNTSNSSSPLLHPQQRTKCAACDSTLLPRSSNSSSPTVAKQQQQQSQRADITDSADAHVFLPPPQQQHGLKYCKSCGSPPPPPSSAPLTFHNYACPLPHYNAELRLDFICNNCLIAQGLYSSIREWNGLYSGMIHERAAIRAARDLCISSVRKTAKDVEGEWFSHARYHDTSKSTSETDREKQEASWEAVSQSRTHMDAGSWHCITSSPEQTVTSALIQLLSTPGFTTLRRRSRCLDSECVKLEMGNLSGASEFLENLDAICGYHNDQDDDNNLLHGNIERKLEMKKEALKLSGDLSAAIKFLHNAALGISPTSSRLYCMSSSTESTFGISLAMGHQQLNTLDMLKCMLELFLDLCEEGELHSVAFFWPQLCQIYLTMLPPMNATELCRVELMEDFLLTVATIYSPHLALGLFWGCLADLEEGLGPLLAVRSASNATTVDHEEDGTSEHLPAEVGDKIRFRRWCVLRFLCELESLIFGFDGGWGGGSVCLRGALAPSEHQLVLIRDAMKTLQAFRIQSHNSLTRSVRRDALLSDSGPSSTSDIAYCNACIKSNKMKKRDCSTPESRLNLDPELLQRNANYISSQLIFVRKLGEIAEKLRFLPVNRREHALVSELRKLNLYLSEGYKSGKLYAAGDPMAGITSIADEDIIDGQNQHQPGLAKVVHLPINEGHVFRSKARTPVLLLMEVLHDITEPKCSTSNATVGEMDQKHSDEEKNATAVLSDTQSVDGSELHNQDENNPTRDLRCLTPSTSQRAVLLKTISTGISPSSERRIHTEGDYPILPTFTPSDRVSQHDSSICDSDSSCRSRLDSSNLNECTIEDVSELVHSAIHEKLAINEKKVKIPKLAVLGGATDPVAGVVPASVERYDSKSTCNDMGVAEEYEMKSTETAESESSSTALEAELSDSREQGNNLKAAPNRRLHDRYNSLTKNVSRRMTALGAQSHRAVNRLHSARTLRGTPNWYVGNRAPTSAHPPLAELGSERREVLATILASSMKGNVIAKGAAAAAQRAIQSIDRRLALDLIRSSEVEGHNSPIKNSPRGQKKSAIQSDTTIELSDQDGDGVYFPSTMDSESVRKESASLEEEDECMESLRIVLLQNRVAQGNLTPEGAARALVGSEGRQRSSFLNHFKGKDAGEVDPRLAGCGPLSHAVHSALQLWKEGIITNGELLELARRDLQFLRQTAFPGSENISNLMEDSAFWVRFSFGERWVEKKARIAARSPYGSREGWDLISVIVKSNDDLRQEAFVMQLIQLCREAFSMAGLELWLHPYRIVSTGKSTGMIELLKNTLSFDSLKKRPGYTGLRGHFERMTEYAANPQEAFQQAQTNFVRSLAAYSLLSYLFLFKDRHNGNLLLDTEGHVIHIDFGFVFGIAPGGSFSLESATPFKLTEEMIEVVGGLNSPLFSDFVTLFCCGFLALQQHADTFCTLVEITCKGSSLPCFAGKDPKEIVEKLRGRFCTQLDKSSTIAYSLDLIRQSLTSYGTRQYDFFQYLSNGVAT